MLPQAHVEEWPFHVVLVFCKRLVLLAVTLSFGNWFSFSSCCHYLSQQCVLASCTLCVWIHYPTFEWSEAVLAGRPLCRYHCIAQSWCTVTPPAALMEYNGSATLFFQMSLQLKQMRKHTKTTVSNAEQMLDYNTSTRMCIHKAAPIYIQQFKLNPPSKIRDCLILLCKLYLD